MENNKISVKPSTIIIVAIIIVALIIGLVYFIMSNNNLKDENSIVSESSNIEQNISSSNSDNTLDNSSDNNSEEISNDTTNNLNEENASTSSSDTNSIVTKTSSKSNPISIGEWGLASKYSSSQYIDVPVKVTDVTRGSVAEQKVKDYCNNSSSIYKYTDAKEGMEWAVIEYTVDLTNIEGYSMGKSIKVDSKITGTGDNTSIKYNGNIYIVSTMSMTTGYSTENIATGYFAVQLPIGCTEYLIALGSSSHTQAFFAGK